MGTDMRGREWRAQVPVGALMSEFQGTRLAWSFPRNPSFLFAKAQAISPFLPSEKSRPSYLCTASKKYSLVGGGWRAGASL